MVASPSTVTIMAKAPESATRPDGAFRTHTVTVCPCESSDSSNPALCNCEPYSIIGVYGAWDTATSSGDLEQLKATNTFADTPTHTSTGATGIPPSHDTMADPENLAVRPHWEPSSQTLYTLVTIALFIYFMLKLVVEQKAVAARKREREIRQEENMQATRRRQIEAQEFVMPMADFPVEPDMGSVDAGAARSSVVESEEGDEGLRKRNLQ